MTQTLKKYITIDEDILGGAPVITGTRIPIERLRELVKQGYTTKDLRKEYPQVSARRIQFLIAYLMEAGLYAFTHYPTSKK